MVGPTLRYAKVVDHEQFLRSGARIRPGLDSGLELDSPPPAVVKPFYVMRAWDDFDAFEETWRITDPYGMTVHPPVTREVRVEDGDLADEVSSMHVEYDSAGYQLILEVDGREVARVGFPVFLPGAAAPAG